jgi:hypothetical protein
VVKVTGGHNSRVSLAALIAVKPGHRPRLIFRVHRACRGGKDKRKGFTEAGYAACSMPPTSSSAGRWSWCGTT